MTTPKFKSGDKVLRTATKVVYPIVSVESDAYVIELPNGEPHRIEHRYVDSECKLLTKLEQVLK